MEGKDYYNGTECIESIRRHMPVEFTGMEGALFFLVCKYMWRARSRKRDPFLVQEDEQKMESYIIYFNYTMNPSWAKVDLFQRSRMKVMDDILKCRSGTDDA